jgi:hypothetical protein
MTVHYFGRERFLASRLPDGLVRNEPGLRKSLWNGRVSGQKALWKMEKTSVHPGAPEVSIIFPLRVKSLRMRRPDSSDVLLRAVKPEAASFFWTSSDVEILTSALFTLWMIASGGRARALASRRDLP